MRKKILIVDDESSITRMLKRLLTDYLSVDVDEFNDSTEALNYVAESAEQFDLVITDLRMPRIDGLELSRRLNRRYPEMPIVILTAYYTPEVERDAMAIGVSKVMVKPFIPRVFIEDIRQMLAGTPERE